jgi:glycosyltransferase involved in cell wall biosynthesis
MDPFVSVIIPTFNEEKHIAPLIENILHQDYPADRLEVFIIDGMSQDRTQEIIGEYHKQNPSIQLLLNEKRFVSFALNTGIKKSRGDVVIRMDAHSEYPSDYISKLVRYLFELKADNVGGTWITKPADDSPKANAIAAALSSVFGVGNAHYRLGVKKARKVDTVPFGCFHKSLFDRIGMFDEELLRNQDDEFNARIIENGGSIYLLPDVTIIYYARRNISSLLKMLYQYSFFKPLVNRKLKRPATARQFIPPLFVVYLLTGWLSVFISPLLFLCFICGTGIYLLCNILFTVKSTLDHGKAYLLFYLPWLFLLQHLTYGIGYLIGIINFVLINKQPEKTITSTR